MSALYTLLLVMEPLRRVNTLATSLLILAAGLGMAFHPRSWRSFCKMMLLAYVVTFGVGGLGMALFFLTDIPHAVYYIAADMHGFSQAISWQLALTGMVLSYAFIKLMLHFYERHTLKRQMLCAVHVQMGGREVTFDALVDTGHSLREPISKTPVIVAEFEHMKPFLPDGLRVLFYEKREHILDGLLERTEEPFSARIRLIPFTSIGRQSGMLIGFRPDRVRVGEGPGREAIIGIYNHQLSSDGRYQGLLSPELVG